jgi:hypothetical protein
MIIDKELFLAEAWAYSVWGNAGSYYGPIILDLTKTKQQIDEPLYLVVRMKAAALTGTSLKFSLVGSPTEWTDAAGTGGTFTELVTSAAILLASLTADTVVFVIRIPQTISQRYLGLKVVSVESSDFTAGTIDAFLVDSLPLAAY